MKTLLAFIIIVLSFSIMFALEGKDIKNPILRRVITKGFFPDVKAVEEFMDTPEDLEGRYSVIAMTDSDTKKWLMQERGETVIFLFHHKLRIISDGITAYEFSIESGMRTIEIYRNDLKNKGETTTYFFSAIDLDDNDPMLLRIAFNRSLLGGSACITLFRAGDLNDWMGFRVQ